MSHTDTLGRTTSTRSVHDGKDLLLLRRPWRDRVRLATLAQFLVGDDCVLRVGRLESLDFAALSEDALLVDDDVLDVGLAQRLACGLEQMRVHEHGGGVGLEKGVLDTSFTEGIIGCRDFDRLGGAGVGKGDPWSTAKRVSMPGAVRCTERMRSLLRIVSELG